MYVEDPVTMFRHGNVQYRANNSENASTQHQSLANGTRAALKVFGVADAEQLKRLVEDEGVH